MPCLSVSHRAAFLGIAFLTSAHGLNAKEAIAHSNHYESSQPEQTSPPNSQQPDLSSKATDLFDTTQQEATSANKIDSDANALSDDNQQKHKPIVEEIPVSQEPASTSKSGLFDGFTIGLGESILAMLIAAPFVLCAWKRTKS
ncbi:hypothetical protein S7335_1431 [Synechococcus sp. PCC 7335]|uniref:hypothetical protein n=1 Tax=Synechococcus sp. (strain ATCC 29403 / PCC 7335) TaxID=91464 RepID=UPI00017EB8BF|nr:hypothetical protein [Synechococcus sp. PCC 7335]EDX83734.1 hypothetical protein S7335_1431 [Synechococcus sp. PCC 7335]